MAVLTIFLCIVAMILIIIAAICLLLLLIPIQYRFDGGYEHIFFVNFRISNGLFAIRGNWHSMPEKSLLVQVIIAGQSFSLHPEKWAKKEKNKEEKKEKKQSKNLSFPAVYRCLERELIGSVMVLLGDLLRILKPKRVVIKGKLGFAEPHLNGWLAAITNMLEQCCEVMKLNIEPVWEEEHYEGTFTIEGAVAICVLLFRLARFMLTRRTLKFLNQLRKEKKASCAA